LNNDPKPIPLDDSDTFFIDNSTLERHVTCPRSAEYYILNKRETNVDKPALAFGGIFHKILEARYLRGTDYITEADTNAMLLAAQEGFAAYSPPDDDFRNYGAAVAGIQHYAQTYPVEPWNILPVDGKPAIEIGFAFPIGEVSIEDTIWVKEPNGTVRQRYVKSIIIVWKGRIDMVYISQGSIYGLDHKTTSIMGPQFFKEFELSHQVHGYAWAIEQLIGQRIRGFTINGLGFRKPTRTGEQFTFKRHTIPIYDGLLDEWVKDTIYIVSDFFEMCRRGYLPKHTKWCQGKYGACPYKPVCTLPTDAQRKIYLNTGEYKDVTWDPLAV